MRELNISAGTVNTEALDAALRAALAGKYHSVSTYGVDRPITVRLEDSATSTDESTALGIVTAHDPVFVTLDKTQISADNVDTAILSVYTPKPGATVTLTINGNDVPIPLVSGGGAVPICALDPALYTIYVKNGSNRNSDILTLRAV